MRGSAAAVSAMLAMVLIIGCAPKAPTPEAKGQDGVVAPITNDDACASRMHDLAGALLLHVTQTGDLPMSLAELQAGPGEGEVPELMCPVSKKPYVYNPTGIYLPERRARLVLYDPAPSHSGMRWGIIGEESDEISPPVVKVIALPESFFVLRPPE